MEAKFDHHCSPKSKHFFCTAMSNSYYIYEVAQFNVLVWKRCTRPTAAFCSVEFGYCQATFKQKNVKSMFDVGKMLMFVAKVILGSVYRCNNVLYIRGVEEEEEDGEMRE